MLRVVLRDLLLLLVPILLLLLHLPGHISYFYLYSSTSIYNALPPASMCNELPLRKVTPNESCDALKSLSIVNAPLASMPLVILQGGFF